MIFCTFKVTSAQLRLNRKPILNPQLYSQIFADLNPNSNSVNNNFDFTQNDLDESYNDFEDSGLRNVREDGKIRLKNLCSANEVFYDMRNDPDFIYHPKIFKNVTCKFKKF